MGAYEVRAAQDSLFPTSVDVVPSSAAPRDVVSRAASRDVLLTSLSETLSEAGDINSRDVLVNAMLAQLGVLITAYAQARGVTLKVLGERTRLNPKVIQAMMAGGEGAKAPAPWSMYDRVFQALKVPREVHTYARDLWDRSRGMPSRSGSWVRATTYEDSLHRLRADVPGHDLQPDPLRASTKEEFLSMMREFHVWAGELSYREISRNAHKSVGASTLCQALDPNKPPRLPTLKLVQAFIQGCGGDEDTVAKWTTAWRQVRMGGRATTVPRLRPVLHQDAG